MEEEYSEELVFTRYLYPKEAVKHSLLCSLLEHNTKEALFWGYELYHSGFHDEIFQVIFNIYREIYSNVNTKKFNDFIVDKYDSWLLNKTHYWMLGTIIWNLSERPYCIDHFIETYFKVKCVKNTGKNDGKKQLLLVMTEGDVQTYDTTNETKEVLKKNVLYGIRNEVQHLFLASYSTSIKTQYLYHWLYYADGSPIWKERIETYNGIKNETAKTIDFSNEENEEEFYNLYNYEPDEQSNEIQEKNIGNDSVKQLSIKEFSQKYGGNIAMRKKIILSSK